MRHGSLAVLAIAFAALSPRAVHAQFRVGPTVAWGDNAGVSVGARALLATNTPVVIGLGNLHGMLGFDYYLDPCDGFDCSLFEITPSLVLPLTVRRIGPIVGIGLNVARWSIDNEPTGYEGPSGTKLGLAVIGGFQFPLAGQLAMADARATLGGGGQVVISFSFLFGGGGGGGGGGEGASR
jgi:hypothetical protein